VHPYYMIEGFGERRMCSKALHATDYGIYLNF
jgi:hypothetical protein